MSGIYMPGMEMPTNCGACPFHKLWSLDDPLQCLVNLELWCDSPERHKLCPLIPVPEHGRTIDADALMHEFEKAQRTMAQHGQEYSCSFMSSSQEISTEWYCVEDMLENAPTIIPAEGGRGMKDYPPYLDYPKERKPQTNYDRIISKTPEELAEWLRNVITECSRCPCNETPVLCEKPCKECLFDWLKSPTDKEE